MSSPLAFTVVIPLYQKKDTIERAISCVLTQSFSQFELLVIDDGSSDGGAELVTKIKDERIQLIKQANAGVSAARNKGIALAKHEYIAFLDADDVWSPSHLEEMARLIQTYPNCGWYSGGLEFITKSRKQPKFTTLDEGVYSNFFDVGLHTIVVHPSSVVIPKTIAKEVGGFPEGISRGEDAIMWIKLASKYPFAYTPKISVRYFFEEGNINKRLKNKEPDIYFEYLEEGNTSKNEYLAIHALHRAKMESIYGQRKVSKEIAKNYAFTQNYQKQLKKLRRLNCTPSILIRLYFIILYILVHTKRKLFPAK